MDVLSETHASATTLVARNLAEAGFAIVDEQFLSTENRELVRSRREFVRSCADLPADAYASSGRRNRRYGAFVLLPWSGTLEALPSILDDRIDGPASCYVQPGNFNPEHASEPRLFASLLEGQRQNAFLHDVIRRCFASISMTRNLPILVGVHIVRLEVGAGEQSAMSPNCVHRDGEPYTWAFLIERSGISGGENAFTSPAMAGRPFADVDASEVLQHHTLRRPFDGWVVDDARVAHYVSPIETSSGVERGHRTVLLIDFTPMMPYIAPA